MTTRVRNKYRSQRNRKDTVQYLLHSSYSTRNNIMVIIVVGLTVLYCRVLYSRVLVLVYSSTVRVQYWVLYSVLNLKGRRSQRCGSLSNITAQLLVWWHASSGFLSSLIGLFRRDSSRSVIHFNDNSAAIWELLLKENVQESTCE